MQLLAHATPSAAVLSYTWHIIQNSVREIPRPGKGQIYGRGNKTDTKPNLESPLFHPFNSGYGSSALSKCQDIPLKLVEITLSQGCYHILIVGENSFPPCMENTELKHQAGPAQSFTGLIGCFGATSADSADYE